MIQVYEGDGEQHPVVPLQHWSFRWGPSYIEDNFRQVRPLYIDYNERELISVTYEMSLCQDLMVLGIDAVLDGMEKEAENVLIKSGNSAKLTLHPNCLWSLRMFLKANPI